MKIRSVVSIPKEEDFPEANEDNFHLRDDKVSCALSDGASESFDSQAWSEILCQSFNFIVKRKKEAPSCTRKLLNKFSLMQDHYLTKNMLKKLFHGHKRLLLIEEVLLLCWD